MESDGILRGQVLKSSGNGCILEASGLYASRTSLGIEINEKIEFDIARSLSRDRVRQLVAPVEVTPFSETSSQCPESLLSKAESLKNMKQHLIAKYKGAPEKNLKYQPPPTPSTEASSLDGHRNDLEGLWVKSFESRKCLQSPASRETSPARGLKKNPIGNGAQQLLPADRVIENRRFLLKCNNSRNVEVEKKRLGSPTRQQSLASGDTSPTRCLRRHSINSDCVLADKGTEDRRRHSIYASSKNLVGARSSSPPRNRSPVRNGGAARLPNGTKKIWR
jgi:hypothetical protein